MTWPRIEIQGDEALAAAFARMPALAVEEMTEAALEASFLVQRQIQERTPVGVSGGSGLRASIGVQEPEILADQVIGVVATSAAHAIPVELGTKPHFPPIQPLADWARHVLGVSEAEAEGVAWAIARTIAHRGTEGAHMFKHGFEAARNQIERIYRQAAADIVSQTGGAA